LESNIPYGYELSTQGTEEIDYVKKKMNEKGAIDLTTDGSLKIVNGNNGVVNTRILSLRSEILPMTVKSNYGQVLIHSINNWVSLFAGQKWDKGRVETTKDG
jgi:hypothetical protein